MSTIDYQAEINKIIAETPRLRAVQWALEQKLSKCDSPYQKCLVIMTQITKDLRRQLEAYNELINLVQEPTNQSVKKPKVISITQSEGQKNRTISPIPD